MQIVQKYTLIYSRRPAYVLEQQKKNIIAVASSNFTHSSPARYFKFLEKWAGAGNTLKQVQVFGGLYQQETQKLTAILQNSPPHGLIGICVQPDKKLLEAYRNAGVPVVLIDEKVEDYSSVSTDNIAGGRMAGEYLAKSRRKRIGMVTGLMSIKGSFTAIQRYKGFSDSLKNSDIRFLKEDLIEVRNYSYSDGIEAAKILLDPARKLDAVFCAAGDICAAGIIKTAFEMGVKIPEQVALIGYDDIDIAAITRPALTTIKQPIELMAQKALEAVTVDRINTLEKGTPFIFQPQLIKRESA
jgi:LacI family transcriptional regulator